MPKKGETPLFHTEILSSAKEEISHIFHISDIHIRRTLRHAEYKLVFSTLYEKLKKLSIKNPSSLIVLTGDILHSKTSLEPETIELTTSFFKNLSSICPLILIAGNHDLNLNNRTRLDSLSPIVRDIPNLFYLKKSGVYMFNNISFGVSSILDGKFVESNAITSKCSHKIALYHGAVHSAVTDVGYRMNQTELTVENFIGYDYVMLGDIHRFQYLNPNKTIAYAGSLIQQSHGETIQNHGILVWDLNRIQSNLVEIPNDYGYCTLNIKDGILQGTELIPKNPRIRFIKENTSELQLNDIILQIKESHQIDEIIVIKDVNVNTRTKQKSPTPIPTSSSKEEVILSYLSKKSLNPEKISTILALHKKLQTKLDKTPKSLANSINWSILELKFSNCLSYGQKNVISFENIPPNKIIGIFAPNKFGKSAILDIILFCLFDRFSRGERKDILNKNESSMKCSLRLNINNNQYQIKRKGSRTSTSVKIDVDFIQIKPKTSSSKKVIVTKLNGLDKNDTNKKITELIGEYDEYLTTCFYLQDKNTNFIDMKQTEKKNYLNNILKLNTFEDCHLLAKEKVKLLSAQLKLLEQKLSPKSFTEIKSSISELNKEIVIIESDLQEKTHWYETFFPQDNPLQPIPIYNELQSYNLSTPQSISLSIHTLEAKLKNFSTISIESTKLSSLKNTLQKLLKEDSNPMDLSEQKDALTKELIPINSKVFDIRAIELDISNITNRINLIGDLEKKYSNSLNKISRINELRSIITDLRSKLKPTTTTAEHDFFSLAEELHQIHLQLQKMDPFSKSSKRFEPHVQQNLLDIQKIITPSSPILSIKKRSIQWLESNKNLHERDPLRKRSSKILSLLDHALISHDNFRQNILITSEINKAQLELDTLSEFFSTDKEIQNLKKEHCLLTEQLAIRTNELVEATTVESNKKKNSHIQSKISLIKNQILHFQNLHEEISLVQKNISSLEKTIEQNSQQLSLQKKLKSDLILLQKYELDYMFNFFKQQSHNLWSLLNKEYQEEIMSLTKKLQSKKLEFALQKKDLEQHLSLRTEFDEKSSTINTYNLYIQTMGSNGLPYKMIQTYLPSIESEINEILQTMVNFNVQFDFTPDDSKQKNTAINLNIQYQDKSPYNVQLASGFEKFIVGLAIRMTFSRISLSPKPSFIVFDEGWTSLDPNNLSNISTIMNNIKNQYEYVIIISHLEDVKMQADYAIHIDLNSKGYSFVKNIEQISNFL